MGKADIESRKYMRDTAHFADVVNYYVFGGRQIVRPDDLTPLDTAEVVIPYGNGARSPVQKYRDTVKLWSAMTDEKVVYVILGAENQTEVHYAMPVRSGLYDFLNYAGQVSEAGKRYRKKTQKENGSAIKLTSGEFLSGFRKDDKLIPVITLVVFFGNTEWDGPMTIHEMLNTQDRQILNLVQDYKIHLVAPSGIADDDFTKFRTDLGPVLQFIKYSDDKDKLDEATKSIDRFRRMDPESVGLINAVTGSDLKIVVNEEGKVDVCTAIDEMRKESRNKGRIEGRIEGHREGKIEGHREGKIEGRREGKIEGSLETLVHLVQKGLISLYDAASEADLTPDEFSLKMKGIN